MSTKPDTRQIPDDILQHAIDEAFSEANHSPLTAIKGSPSWTQTAHVRLALARGLLARLPEPTPNAEDKLAQAGVIKRADGLRQLAECDEFWEQQPYGTRLYPDDSGVYLHRDVLRAAIKFLDGKGPEPTPPVSADGKTPGHTAYRTYYCGETDRWGMLLAGDRARWEACASAVLAAFGQPGLEAAIARMEAVPWFGACNCFNQVRARLIAAARDGQGEAVDGKARAEKAEAQADCYKHALASFTKDNVSQLRPIAEAGPVPDGCVRVTGARNNEGTWELAEAPATSFDTHFADIRLPSPAASQDSQPTASQDCQPAVGDVVQLKSGGPVMAVNAIESKGLLDVIWISPDGCLQSASLAAACLTPAKEAQP